MTHTPGPWVVNPFSAQVDCSAVDEDGDLLPICQLLWPTEYRSEEETFDNGSLIAAAPELRAALKCLLATFSKPDAEGNYTTTATALDVFAAVDALNSASAAQVQA